MVRRTRKMKGGTLPIMLYRLLKEKLRTKSSHELLQDAVNKLDEEKIKGIITIDPSIIKKRLIFRKNISYEILELLCSLGYTPTTENLRDILYDIKSFKERDKIFNLLIKHGADINDYVSHSGDYDESRKKQYTLPQLFNYDIDALKILIKYGADINKLDIDGNHICYDLMYRFQAAGFQEGDYEILKLLKDNGLNLKKCYTKEKLKWLSEIIEYAGIDPTQIIKLLTPPKSRSRSRSKTSKK